MKHLTEVRSKLDPTVLRPLYALLDRRACNFFLSTAPAHHPFHDGIVNKGLAGNTGFSHKLEDRRDCFRLDAGDAVEIGYRVAVMLLDTLGVRLPRIFRDDFKRSLFLAMQGGHACGV